MGAATRPSSFFFGSYKLKNSNDEVQGKFPSLFISTNLIRFPFLFEWESDKGAQNETKSVPRASLAKIR